MRTKLIAILVVRYGWRLPSAVGPVIGRSVLAFNRGASVCVSGQPATTRRQALLTVRHERASRKTMVARDVRSADLLTAAGCSC